MSEKCVFDLGEKCYALNEKKCQGCNFFKTRQQLDAGRAKAKKLLNEKYGFKERAAICHKYYSGRKPEI